MPWGGWSGTEDDRSTRSALPPGASRRRARPRLALATLLLAAPVAGCGGDGDGDKASTTRDTRAPQTRGAAVPQSEFAVTRGTTTLVATAVLPLRDAEIVAAPGGRLELRGEPAGSATYTTTAPARSTLELPAASLAAALDGIVGRGALQARVGETDVTLRSPRVRGGRLRLAVTGAGLRAGSVDLSRLEGAVRRPGVQLRERCPVLPFVTCSKRRLKQADLPEGDLRGADLRRADLHRAWAPNARFAAADLRGADLRGADLTGADLRGADLRNADLSDANLRGVLLAGASLDGALVCGTRLPPKASERKRIRSDCNRPVPQSVPGGGARTLRDVPPAVPPPVAPAPAPDDAPVSGDRGPSVLATAGALQRRVITRNDARVEARTASLASDGKCQDPAADGDGDGVPDCTEAAGIEISVSSAPTLTTATRQVTSDPTKTDTDGDGLDDGDEYSQYSDPTKADTDNDQLGDADEVKRYASDPTDADSDKDATPEGQTRANSALFDGNEVTRSKTSPMSADTDGDSLGDLAEVTGGGGFRRARIADLPRFSVGVRPPGAGGEGGTGVKIDVPITTTTSTVDSTEYSTSKLTSTKSRESHSAEVKVGLELSQEFESSATIGFPISKGSTTQTLGFQESVSAATTNEWETTKSAEDEYGKVRSTEASTEKEIGPEGCLLVDMLLTNTSERIGFDLTEMQVTAAVPDAAGGQARRLATLQPTGGPPTMEKPCPGANDSKLTSLGPSGTAAVTFAGEGASEDLLEFLADPGPITFSMNGYRIENNEKGDDKRSFAKVLQAVTNNDAGVVIDFGAAKEGADRLVREQVAANLERDRTSGEDLGITAADALELLGLKPVFGAGRRGEPTVTSLGGVANAADANGGTWVVKATEGTGLEQQTDLKALRLKPGQTLFLSYLADKESDGIPDGLEALEGTSPDSKDTDGDGLSDALETKVGWTVPLPDPKKPKAGQNFYTVFSSPISCDADRDGSPDGPGDGNDEYGTCRTQPGGKKAPPENTRQSASATGDPPRTTGTDPNLPDTNSDGQFDGAQANPLANVPAGSRVPNFESQFGGTAVGSGGGGSFQGPTAISIDRYSSTQAIWVDDPARKLVQGMRLPAEGGQAVHIADINKGVTGKGLVVSSEQITDTKGTNSTKGQAIQLMQVRTDTNNNRMRIREFNSTNQRETSDDQGCCYDARPRFAAQKNFDTDGLNLGDTGRLKDVRAGFLDVDASRNLYVAAAIDDDSKTRPVQVAYNAVGGGVAKLTRDGRYIRSYGRRPSSAPGVPLAFRSDTIGNPSGIAVDPDGDVFVVDASWPENAKVLKFRGTDGQLLRSFSDAKGLRDPTGVGVDANGCVYVTAGIRNGSGGNVVHKLNNNLTHLSSFGGTDDGKGGNGKGPGNGLFKFPVDVDVDRAGNVYVLDKGNNLVQRFRYPRGEGGPGGCDPDKASGEGGGE